MSNKTRRILAAVCVAVFLIAMFAGCMAAPAAEGAEGETPQSPLGSYTYIIMFVLLIVVFYFFLIRPENKKKKKLAEMRNELSVGDEITTIGGLTGKICSIKDDLITFETGEDRVRIQVTKWAISTKGTDTNQAQK